MNQTAIGTMTKPDRRSRQSFTNGLTYLALVALALIMLIPFVSARR